MITSKALNNYVTMFPEYVECVSEILQIVELPTKFAILSVSECRSVYFIGTVDKATGEENFKDQFTVHYLNDEEFNKINLEFLDFLSKLFK